MKIFVTAFIVSIITLTANAQMLESWSGEGAYLTVKGEEATVVFAPSGCGWAQTGNWIVEGKTVIAQGIYSFQNGTGPSPGSPVLIKAEINGSSMLLSVRTLGGRMDFELEKNSPRLVPECSP